MFKKLANSLPDIIKFSLGLLDRNSKRKLLFSGFVLCMIGLLDLLAIVVLSVIASLSLYAVNNSALNNNLLSVLRVIGLENKSIYFTVGLLLFVMVTLFIARTIITLFYTSKIYNFLAYQNNIITKVTLIKLLNQDIRNLRKLPSQETLFALTNGLNASVVGLN